MAIDPDMLKRLVDCNFMDIIPIDIREKVKNARIKFFALRDELANGTEAGKPLCNFVEPNSELFSDIYTRPGKVNRMDSLPADKKFTVIQVTLEMLGIMPFEFEKKNQKTVNKVSKNQRRKENRKKYKKGKQRKRGGKRKDEGQENVEKEESLSEDEEIEEIRNVPYTPYEIQKKAEEMREKVRIAKEKDEAEKAAMGWVVTPEMEEERLKEDEERVENMKRLVHAYEEVEDALIDLVTSSFLDNRDNTLNGFSNIIGNLIQPLNYSKENYEKVKGIVEVFSSPREDYLNDADTFYDEDVRKERCDKANIVIPPVDDQENFAKIFIATLTSGVNDNHQKIFEMASIIAKEHHSNLLKQKVVEICMPDLMKILKGAVLSHELYMTELIFKVTMALPCARKYCWRDPDYFPTLSKLLAILDPNPALDKYQIRGDAVHILYMSILAGPRDVYEQVAVTRTFEHLVTILKDNPLNHRDAQTGEDVIMCVTLFTEHWDLFEKDMRKYNIARWVQKWRRYALEYSSLFPNFIWSLEHLGLRLSVLMKSDEIREKKPDYRLSSPEVANRAREFIKTNNQTACSYPPCYKLNGSESENRYKKCSKCNLAYYCCKECQLNHWRTHKTWCKRFGDKEKKIEHTEHTEHTETKVLKKLANNAPQESDLNSILVQNTLKITEVE